MIGVFELLAVSELRMRRERGQFGKKIMGENYPASRLVTATNRNNNCLCVGDIYPKLADRGVDIPPNAKRLYKVLHLIPGNTQIERRAFYAPS